VCRGVASKIAEAEAETLVVGQKDLHEYLGPAPNMPDLALRIKHPGVVIGLAWTPYGGEILFIEAVAMTGGKGLALTGQLGDVMKESANTALSFIRANAKKLKVDDGFFDAHDLHIHVPEGSIPKDGPSAGVAMLTCLTSLMTGRQVKKRLAMSGEITLRGEVLPVGGIKEKVIAAHRAGIKTIILPLWNQKDMEDVPDSIRDSIEFHFTDKMRTVLELALD
jgi:ATP-dependent Lon protease